MLGVAKGDSYFRLVQAILLYQLLQLFWSSQQQPSRAKLLLVVKVIGSRNCSWLCGGIVLLFSEKEHFWTSVE